MGAGIPEGSQLVEGENVVMANPWKDDAGESQRNYTFMIKLWIYSGAVSTGLNCVIGFRLENPGLEVPG
jgi:hypothetical protein